MALACACVVTALALAACGLGGGQAPQATDDPAAAADPSAGAPTVSDPMAQDRVADQVEKAIAGMTLEEKVWQLFIVQPEAITGMGQVVAAGDATREALAERPVGGLIYFGTNLQDADQTREMLSNTLAYGYETNGLPLFLCVDEEGGTVSRVGGSPGFDVENVGNMSEVGATGDASRAYEAALEIGAYLTDLGFNVDFAPDADIASNPDGEMGLRSFGATADAVAPMVAAQVRGFSDAGILCAAKHFPGIGGAQGDSHSVSIYSYATLDELRAAELVPFGAAIEEGVPFVMVGHLSLPEVTGDNDPACVSEEVVTGILREELGYEGIVVTDSMSMGAVTEAVGSDRAAVEALLAGADMVLMPADLDAAHQGVMDALASGELTEERVNESLRRILAVKLSLAEGAA